MLETKTRELSRHLRQIEDGLFLEWLSDAQVRRELNQSRDQRPIGNDPDVLAVALSRKWLLFHRWKSRALASEDALQWHRVTCPFLVPIEEHCLTEDGQAVAHEFGRLT